MQLFTIPPWINLSYLIAVAVLALWRGGLRERAIGAALLVEIATESPLGIRWDRPDWFVPGYDVVMLAVCLACVRGSHRYWTICASSFALLAVVTHAVRLMARDLTAWSYMSAELVWTYLLVAALLVGVLQHERARRREREPEV